MKDKKTPKIIAISGVKNSGKTTLIEKIIPKLIMENLKVATIKHDGHDFEGDIEGTDTFRHKKSGAMGTAIFSNNKFMVIKEAENITEKDLIHNFKDADVVLLEGFKYSDYPKLEIVRKGNSKESVCKKETLIALVSDFDIKVPDVEVLDLNDIDSISECLLQYIRRG
ncbi:MAG: molybdopterin-guanine dinucleotide biosynthesis protein B [Clostridium sp.]|nr:molybdopterin-guanine dinucleotide biosynthesis protein B [Clostridium sp.]